MVTNSSFLSVQGLMRTLEAVQKVNGLGLYPVNPFQVLLTEYYKAWEERFPLGIPEIKGVTTLVGDTDTINQAAIDAGFTIQLPKTKDPNKFAVAMLSRLAIPFKRLANATTGTELGRDRKVLYMPYREAIHSYEPGEVLLFDSEMGKIGLRLLRETPGLTVPAMVVIEGPDREMSPTELLRYAKDLEETLGKGAATQVKYGSFLLPHTTFYKAMELKEMADLGVGAGKIELSLAENNLRVDRTGYYSSSATLSQPTRGSIEHHYRFLRPLIALVDNQTCAVLEISQIGADSLEMF